MQNLPICMNGSGFPLSKKVLCKSIKLPVTGDTTGKGCTVRMTSLGLGAVGPPCQAEVSPDETEFCIKP